MRILFNSKFDEHNIYSEAEGNYRIKEFKGTYKDEAFPGEEYVTLVHTEEYKEMIKESCMDSNLVAEVKLTPASYEAACLAVGLTVKASEENQFAVVRPPGHHAGRQRAAGFCFFNNVAIAAQRLVNQGKKVFILDIDGHHGDGTQAIFYDTDKVFYCSIHQLFAYPYTGFPEETGNSDGEGYTLNIPLVAGSGDKEFKKALELAIGRARDFNPDVVAVSAGFDGYVKDKLLGLEYTLKSFYDTGFKLRRSFKNIFAVLEGGYHNEVKDCVESFINGVNNGGKPPRIKYDHNMALG